MDLFFLLNQLYENTKLDIYCKNENKNRFQFSDMWFLFPDSSWTFQEAYFSRKHVFHKSYRVIETLDSGLYYVLFSESFLPVTTSIIHFSVKQMFCKTRF